MGTAAILIGTFKNIEPEMADMVCSYVHYDGDVDGISGTIRDIARFSDQSASEVVFDLINASGYYTGINSSPTIPQMIEKSADKEETIEINVTEFLQSSGISFELEMIYAIAYTGYKAQFAYVADGENVKIYSMDHASSCAKFIGKMVVWYQLRVRNDPRHCS